MSLPEKLLTVDQWVAERPDLYPSDRHSFEWRWQCHKERYLRAGAVLIVAKQRRINPQVMGQVEHDLMVEATERFLARWRCAAVEATR